MPRRTRTHIGVQDTLSSERLTPKHLAKEEFGRRVFNLLRDRGWNQSDLARQAGLGRDKISVYITGKAFPTPASLKAIADALHVKPEELLPNHFESAIDADNPAFEMKVSNAAPNTAWLRVNRLVSMVTAVKIAELLQNDDAFNRSGSGSASAVQQGEG